MSFPETGFNRRLLVTCLNQAAGAFVAESVTDPMESRAASQEVNALLDLYLAGAMDSMIPCCRPSPAFHLPHPDAPLPVMGDGGSAFSKDATGG